jgi:hypothetical protein
MSPKLGASVAVSVARTKTAPQRGRFDGSLPSCSESTLVVDNALSLYFSALVALLPDAHRVSGRGPPYFLSKQTAKARIISMVFRGSLSRFIANK